MKIEEVNKNLAKIEEDLKLENAKKVQTLENVTKLKLELKNMEEEKKGRIKINRPKEKRQMSMKDLTLSITSKHAEVNAEAAKLNMLESSIKKLDSNKLALAKSSNRPTNLQKQIEDNQKLQNEHDHLIEILKQLESVDLYKSEYDLLLEKVNEIDMQVKDKIQKGSVSEFVPTRGIKEFKEFVPTTRPIVNYAQPQYVNPYVNPYIPAYTYYAYSNNIQPQQDTMPAMPYSYQTWIK